MAQIVKLRRSSVSGQKPTNSNLQLGELALNTTDGKVFMAVSGSLGPTVEELISTNTVNTGSINLVGSITASNGDTTIAGNVTLSYSGGTDNGTKTSAVVFKNSSNVLGYVSTTESTDVLDGILGYKNSDGTLKFSTVIDGGVY